MDHKLALNTKNLYSLNIVKWKETNGTKWVKWKFVLMNGMLSQKYDDGKIAMVCINDIVDSMGLEETVFQLMRIFKENKQIGFVNALKFFLYGPSVKLSRGVLRLKNMNKMRCMCCGRTAAYLCKCRHVQACSRKCYKIMWKKQRHRDYCTMKLK